MEIKINLEGDLLEKILQRSIRIDLSIEETTKGIIKEYFRQRPGKQKTKASIDLCKKIIEFNKDIKYNWTEATCKFYNRNKHRVWFKELFKEYLAPLKENKRLLEYREESLVELFEKDKLDLYNKHKYKVTKQLAENVRKYYEEEYPVISKNG